MSDTLDPMMVVAKEHDLDAVQILVLAYRVGAKGVATFQQLADYLSTAGHPMQRQRVQQIEKLIREKIGEETWERLRGVYVANRPVASSKTNLKQQLAALRVHLRDLGRGDSIQYGTILDMLNIPFKKEDSEDPYALNEMQSCQKFLKVFGLRNFGRYRYCVRCEQIKPVSQFYRVGGKKRPYSSCKLCNSQRCREFVDRKQQQQVVAEASQ